MRPYKILTLAIILIATTCMATPAFAATSAKLHVSATILSYVSFTASQNVATYQVRSEDLQRGYVDLPNAITVTLRTNVTKGVSILVDNWGTGRVLIKESGTGSYFDNLFTMKTAGSRSGDLISKMYDSRIVLPSDAREGIYPLTIAMSPAM